MADKIQDNIRTKGEPICADIWVKINKICQKTVQDLIAILRELEGYQAHVLPIDQNKRKNSIDFFNMHTMKCIRNTVFLCQPIHDTKIKII